MQPTRFPVPPDGYRGPTDRYPATPDGYSARHPLPPPAAFPMALPGVADAAMHYQPAGPASGGVQDGGSPYAHQPPPFHHRGYGSPGSMYPSTLHPARHIRTHHHSHHQPLHPHPVKLLQSCDSCRRRKIRCSGERPCCSSCIRYQEGCHYSPLATPRRRTGKRGRASADDGHADDGHPGDGHPADDYSASSHQGDDRPPPPATAPADYAGRADVPAAADRGAAAAASGPESWQSEAGAMRRDMVALGHKFDDLSDKLDALIGAIGKRRRLNTSEDLSDVESSDESTSQSHVSARHVSRVGAEFPGRIDRTSRFGIDMTNVGVISTLMSDFDQARTASREQKHEGHDSDQPRAASDRRSATPAAERQSQRTAALQRLESKEMRSHLVDTFYRGADGHLIALIPRHIFDQLQRDKRVPGVLISVIMADACGYSDHEAVHAVGHRDARDYFIERAYGSLFACLEYDSVEHCVSLALFATVSSHAGLHRCWIMQSLGMQMCLRMRFNTLDSPLNAAAFSGDTAIAREWKRRVFWQLYSADILSSTLGDLPPCLMMRSVRCRPPHALLAADGDDLAVLGPAFVLCSDQPTIELQIDLLDIMCDIATLQSSLVPEDGPFPEGFYEVHERLTQWQQRLPQSQPLVAGTLEQASEGVRERPGLASLGFLFHYTRILLYLIKDTWLPTQRALSDKEQSTLEWARGLAQESAQMVHRLVPVVRGMEPASFSSFVPCVILQACVATIHACNWDNDPRRTMAAINNIQTGLEFLEHVAPRWGFAGMLMASLRTLIVDSGIGSHHLRGGTSSSGGDRDGSKEITPASGQTAGSASTAVPTAPADDVAMQVSAEELRWERILRVADDDGGCGGSRGRGPGTDTETAKQG
ncbi:hypothetical protein H4R19_000470 [Coemansia spiralis]|nr:hypothetical protein H4R19_000470 [Coemansia spiralis]